jgi:pyruvate/2-oxoglutarate dehydrogenase complex dihydrolipoamide dehydrogenase (E3) component
MYHEAGFDKTVDVIVVGFGDAGAVAAAARSTSGASRGRTASRCSTVT